MHADSPEMVNHYLLDVDVLESVRVADQLGLVIDPFLVGLEGVCSSPV